MSRPTTQEMTQAYDAGYKDFHRHYATSKRYLWPKNVLEHGIGRYYNDVLNDNYRNGWKQCYWDLIHKSRDKVTKNRIIGLIN